MLLSKEDTVNISMLAVIFFLNNAMAIFEIKNKYMIKLLIQNNRNAEFWVHY